MPHVFRKTYSRPIPEGAQRTTMKVRKRGKDLEVQAVRFKGDDGRAVTVPLTKGGTRCRVQSPTWYGWVAGKEVPLCTNKGAAEIMLGDKIREAERGEAGLTDAFDKHRKAPSPNTSRRSAPT